MLIWEIVVVFHNIVVFNVFFDRINVGQIFEQYCR